MDERAPKTYLPWWRFLLRILYPFLVWLGLLFATAAAGSTPPASPRGEMGDDGFWLLLSLCVVSWPVYCIWAVAQAFRRLRRPWAMPVGLLLLVVLPILPWLDQMLCAPEFDSVCRALKTEITELPDTQGRFHGPLGREVTMRQRCLLPWMRITVEQDQLRDHASGEMLASCEWARYGGGWLPRILLGDGADSAIPLFMHPYCSSRRTNLKHALNVLGIREYADPLPQYPTSPSDEAMLEHFRTNRAAFEELTRYYRARLFAGREYAGQGYPFKQRKSESPEPGDADMDALLRRAGAARVETNGAIGQYWLPDPYNPETARRRDFNIWKCEKEAPDRQAEFQCRYTSPEHAALLIFPEAGGDDGKVWLHIPVVPKIERGVLLGPVSAYGVPSSATFVRDSLNLTPPHWEKGECVLRPIDAQWFLRLCRAREE